MTSGLRATVGALAIAALVVLVSACGEAPDRPPAADAPSAGAADRGSIVDVAVAAGQFSSLVRAVEAAGLTQTLETDGPFTVFAPTDGAFANLPDGALEELLDDPEALSQVLLYHVVPGELISAHLGHPGVQRDHPRDHLGSVAGFRVMLQRPARGPK